jgi:iron-sulfur cluster repair protein YtfE (RIC family)
VILDLLFSIAGTKSSALYLIDDNLDPDQALPPQRGVTQSSMKTYEPFFERRFAAGQTDEKRSHTQSINQYYREDHDRLDDLFHEFTNSKASDRQVAEKSFGEFKAGLERHIVWEEEILFPAFEKKFNCVQGGPTEVMRLEHREIRKCLEAIARKLAEQNFDMDDEEGRLVPVLCLHNQKEEGILYPMMDRMFSEHERAALFSAMNVS